MNRLEEFDCRSVRKFRVGARPFGLMLALFGATAMPFLAGCATAVTEQAVAAGAPPEGAGAILEGDQLKISFVGAPSMDTLAEVRRDGRITLPIAGEVVAAGKTPDELSAELRQRYANELIASEVVVSVVASVFEVNVSGAVLRPGKYASKRPMTALEAVMEAGGFDHAKADIKRVVVVRHRNGAVSNFVLDLSLALNGKPSEPFYLQPSDIVFVPTRFVWF